MNHRRRLGLACGLAALLVILLAPPSAAEMPALLVADLVLPQQGSSFPSPIVKLGGVAYFAAEDSLHGRELWRTEGTPETTRLVADFCPGACTGFPTAVVVGGRLFVYANTGESAGLFTSDGTAAGTRLIHRFVDSVSLSSPLIAFGDRVWFVLLEHQPFHYTLWQSDGTAAGTAPWPVDCGEACQAASAFLGAAGDELFFGVTTAQGDTYRLWRTDGTTGGTRPAEPSCPPSCVSLFSPAGVAGGHYYFTGFDAAHGAEVWVAGGGLPAPRLVADLSPGADSAYLTWGFDFAGEAWFRVTGGSSGRWFRFTPTGATVATEVEPLGAAKAPWSLWPAGDRLFFAVPDDNTQSLWTVRPGAEAPRRLLSGLGSIDRVGELGGLAFVRVYHPGDNRPRLLVSDGTVAGTQEIAGVSPAPIYNQPSVTVGGGILFAADDALHGLEPWLSDGTATGTRALRDLRQTGISSPSHLAAVGDEVAFAVGGNAGHDLYVAGATAGAPPAARRLLTGGYFSEVVGSGGRLFAAHLPPTGYEPWSVLAIEPASGATQSNAVGSMPFHLTPWNGGVAFGEYADNEPLWTSDGTAAGTRKVLDLAPGYSPFCPILCPYPSLYPVEMTPVGDRLYFVAVDDNGDNVWTSDGSAAGTVPLASSPGSYALVSQLTPFQGGVALVRYGDSSTGGPGATEIWKSGGTVASTGPLFAVTGYPTLLGALGNKLIYALRKDGVDTVVATDGTAVGTAVLHELGGAALHPRVRSLRASEPAALEPLVVRDRLFFVVADDAAGEELWVSDGTPAGTRRVADVRPGNLGSHPQSLAAYRGCALFAASDGVAGYEPWASDGQTAWRVADVAPGEAASSPGEITPAGGFVYFTADDGVHGRETFAVATTELDARCTTQPPVNPGPPPGSLTSAAAPGFAFLVKVGPAGAASTGSLAPCMAGTMCVTGTASGRGDVFLRMVPTSTGRVAPAIVKLTPDEVEVTVHQLATGTEKVYRLAATVPPSGVLAGVLGRDDFATATATSATFESMALRANEPAKAGAGARWFKPRDIPGYRFKAWLIDAAGKRTAVRAEGCVEGTLCLSGPLRGRTDVLVRLLDRRPAAARLTGAGLELWVERTKTGELRKFVLPAEGPTSTSLDGVLDPVGFRR